MLTAKSGRPLAQSSPRLVRQLALEAVLAEIGRAFSAGGVSYVLLKGPAFARWLYEQPLARISRDLDLLIAPAHGPLAAEALANLGFAPDFAGVRPSERIEHHDVWVRDRGVHTPVELHRTLFLLSAPQELVWDRLSRGSRLIEISDVKVPVPSEPASLLIAVLHAAQHGIRAAKPIEDLRRAVERADMASWREASLLSCELGAVEAFGVGLRLDPRGCGLAAALGLPTGSSRRLRILAATAPDTTMGIDRLLSTRGALGRMRVLGQELWPSGAFMRASQPLARRGRWGLALAYAWRPLRIAAKLPRGLRAWWQAGAGSSKAREP